MQTAIGADLSLNHGSVILVEMGENIVTNVVSVYSWNKKDNHKLTLESTPQALFTKVKEISAALSVHNVTVLGIDWFAQSVYWSTKKLFVVQMGLFLGMLYAEISRKNIYFLPISPRQLREYFNQPLTLSKKDFQHFVLLLFPPPILFNSWATEDDIDAYILAVYTILTKGKNDRE